MSHDSKQMNRRSLLTGWRRALSEDQEPARALEPELEHTPEPAPSPFPPPATTDVPMRALPDAPAPALRTPPKRAVMPSLRPPGAVDARSFLSLCDACGECVRACPHDALFQETGPDGSPRAPAFDMVEAPCQLCPDRPCVTACPTGALDASRPTRIGRAYLRVMNCLATSLSSCSVCVERCPVEDALELLNGKPRFNPTACVGCGECLYRCPAPTKAITIMPC